MMRRASVAAIVVFAAAYLAARAAVHFDPVRMTAGAAAAPGDPMTALLEAMSLAPEDAEARLALARAYDGQDQWREAERQYREALRVRPESMMGWEELARLYERGERPDLAANAWQEAAAFLRTPQERRLAEQAAERARKVAAGGPYDTEKGTAYWKASGELERGRALAADGDLKAAAAALQTALSVDPTMVEAARHLGVVQSARGDRGGAAQAFRTVLRLAPGDASTMLELAWILATASDSSLRNGSEALALAQAASAKQGSNDPATLDTLAAAFAAAGDFERAGDEARRALELGRNLGDVEWLEGVRARLALYESGRAFVVESPQPH